MAAYLSYITDVSQSYRREVQPQYQLQPQDRVIHIQSQPIEVQLYENAFLT